MLWLRLLLAPSLVALVSIVSARFGARLGGILGAFPLVSGPILLLFALEQGADFTTEAAIRTLYGTLSLVVYCLVYATLASRPRRPSPWLCLLLGWCAFLILTLLLEAIPGPRSFAAPVAVASVLLGLWLVPQPVAAAECQPDESRSRSHRHLLLRMAAAALLVFTLSEAANALGPEYSGLLTPFPVASTVLLVATHLEHGKDTMLGWLHGFLSGLFGYVTFVLGVSVLLAPLGIGAAFSLALVGALVVQTAVTRFSPAQSSRRLSPPRGGAE